MTEKEFEQKLTLILLESLMCIKEIERDRRERVGEFDKLLSDNDQKKLTLTDNVINLSKTTYK